MTRKRADIPDNLETTEGCDSDEFSINRDGEEYAAVTQKCKNCGCKHFYVGVGSYYTAVKCVNCGAESCIHNG